MHEKKLQENILAQFAGKPNQSFEYFVQSFDYINDASVQIRSPNYTKSKQIILIDSKEEISTEVKKQIKHDNNDIDQIEDIELVNTISNNHGFWKGSNPVITKFDNFLPDEEPDMVSIKIDKNLNSFDADNFLFNLSYTPSVMGKSSILDNKQIDGLSNLTNIDYALTEHSYSTTNLNINIKDNKEDEEIVTKKEYNDKKVSNLDENLATEFPGEIIDHSEVVNKFHITELDLETIIAVSDKVEMVIEQSSVVHNDMVESFEMETSHDYSQNHNKPRYNF